MGVLDVLFSSAYVILLHSHSVVNRIAFLFAFSAPCSRASAAMAQHRQSGGHTRATRCTQRHQPSAPSAFCVVSAASPVLPARYFSGKIVQFSACAINTFG